MHALSGIVLVECFSSLVLIFLPCYLLPTMSKKTRSFKTFEQDLARSQDRLRPQIVEGTQTRYAEHVTVAAGSSTTSRSILPLPTQPILLKTPLTKDPELVETISKDEKGKEKERTQARNTTLFLSIQLITST